MVRELETRLERLRQLYDQYFLGYEKLEPQVPRKDVERRVELLRREQIRNTALRFRFTVVTQKLNTYQALWHRTCRAIEDGTFKRHLAKAAKRFGPGATGKKGVDIELDIDIDLGELEAEVASDLEAISDEERRLLAKVDAELRGEPVGGDTERPAQQSKRRVVEDDDDSDEDMPTNRPPASMNVPGVTIPKSPNAPSIDTRSHTAAPFGNTRPNIRKTDPGAQRGTGRTPRSAPPQYDSNAPVMPKVASAPPPPMREHGSASKIALPVPGRESANMRAAPASTSMRLAPPGSASAMRAAAPAHAHDGAREAASDGGSADRGRAEPDGSAGRSSGHMRAALPVPGTSIRLPPPGVQSRLAPPGMRTSPGAISTSMRAAAPTTNPGSPPGNPALRLPPPGTSARGSLPMPGGNGPKARGDVPGANSGPPKTTGEVPPMRPRAPSIGNSKPPPPLPSSITQRGKQPSLSDLAADAKDKDKK